MTGWDDTAELSEEENSIVIVQSYLKVLLSKQDKETLLERRITRNIYAKQLLKSEIGYVQGLKITLKSIKTPLSDTAPQELLTKMLQPIEAIIELHKRSVLPALQQRIERRWHNSQVLGNMFSSATLFEKVYNKQIEAYADSIRDLAELKAAMLETQIPVPDYESYSKFMLVPFKMLTARTKHLIDIRKNTENEHPDASLLDQAISNFGGMASSFEDQLQSIADYRELEALRSRLGGLSFAAVGRRILRRGKLDLILSKSKIHKASVLLLNDSLLIWSEDRIKPVLLNLAESWQAEMPYSLDFVNSFILVEPRNTVVLQADTFEKKKEWMSVISEICDTISTNESRARRVSPSIPQKLIIEASTSMTFLKRFIEMEPPSEGSLVGRDHFSHQKETREHLDQWANRNISPGMGSPSLSRVKHLQKIRLRKKSAPKKPGRKRSGTVTLGQLKSLQRGTVAAVTIKKIGATAIKLPETDNLNERVVSEPVEPPMNSYPKRGQTLQPKKRPRVSTQEIKEKQQDSALETHSPHENDIPPVEKPEQTMSRQPSTEQQNVEQAEPNSGMSRLAEIRSRRKAPPIIPKKPVVDDISRLRIMRSRRGVPPPVPNKM